MVTRLERGAAAVFVLLGACVAQSDAAVCRPSGRGPGLKVPIITYHHIGTPRGEYPRLWVEAAAFTRQMEALASSGAESLTMSEVAASFCARRTFQRGVFVITFDDATADQMLALPVLRKHHLRATMYVPPARVGRAGYLTWEQLREFRDSGLVSIQGHTMSHADLVRLPIERARGEIVEGARMLERRLGVRVTQFAYPFGHVNPAVERLVRDAGFATAVTVHWKWVHEPSEALRWGRFAVQTTTMPAGLAGLAKASGVWTRSI